MAAIEEAQDDSQEEYIEKACADLAKLFHKARLPKEKAQKLKGILTELGAVEMREVIEDDGNLALLEDSLELKKMERQRLRKEVEKAMKELLEAEEAEISDLCKSPLDLAADASAALSGNPFSWVQYQTIHAMDQSGVVTKNSFLDFANPKANLRRTQSEKVPEVGRILTPLMSDSSPVGARIEEQENEEEERSEGAADSVQENCGLLPTMTHDPFFDAPVGQAPWERSYPAAAPAPPALDVQAQMPATTPMEQMGQMPWMGMPGMMPGMMMMPPMAPMPWGYPTGFPPSTSSQPPESRQRAPPPERHVPAQLELSHSPTSGSRIAFTVRAKLLYGADCHPHVSPEFKLSTNTIENVPFKIQICPKASTDQTKGGSSFKKAGGQGHVELAHVGQAALPDDAPALTYSITLGTGYYRRTRGTFTHNFVDNKTTRNSSKEESWEFRRSVDKEAQTFTVCVEIRDGEPWQVCIPPEPTVEPPEPTYS